MIHKRVNFCTLSWDLPMMVTSSRLRAFIKSVSCDSPDSGQMCAVWNVHPYNLLKLHMHNQPYINIKYEPEQKSQEQLKTSKLKY
jgi:hypothetical protein